MKQNDSPLNTSSTAGSTLTNEHFAGINIGRGHVKLKTDKQYLQYASLVQRAKNDFKDLDFMTIQTQKVIVDGVEYHVGEEVGLTGERTAEKNVYTNWANTTPYKVLMQSVLDHLGKESPGPWSIMLGMPVKEYLDEVYRSQLVSMWKRVHATANGPVEITCALASPEPIGAFWHYVLRDESRMDEISNEKVIVLDIGYFTTDVNAINRMRLSDAIAVSITVGMRDVFRRTGELIQKKCGKVCTAVEVEMAVLDVWPLIHKGRQLSIAEEIKMAVSEVGENLMQWTKAAIDRADGLLLVAGGGAHLFTDVVKQNFPQANVVMVDDPQEANAYGYYHMIQTTADTH